MVSKLFVLGLGSTISLGPDYALKKGACRVCLGSGWTAVSEKVGEAEFEDNSHYCVRFHRGIHATIEKGHIVVHGVAAN